MAKPNKICPLPWISIETTPMGGCRPCCLAKDEIPDIDLRKDTIQDAFDSPYMQDLRMAFQEGGQPETCTRCWEEEDAGITSKRQNTMVRLKEIMPSIDFTNIRPATDQLQFLDLKLGNVCNLKCRICGSWSSSKWAKEEMDLFPGNVNAINNLKNGAWPKNNNQFWNNLKLIMPHVKYIEFTGGEPFLVPEHAQLIRWLQTERAEPVNHQEWRSRDRVLAQDIELHYNTNATQTIPNLNKFKKVEIAFSIDNVGKRFEYERFGANWNFLFEETARTDNIEFQLCFTINIQNVMYLDQLLLWADNKFQSVHWNYLHDPFHMGVQHMTPEAKQMVLDNIDHHYLKVLPKHTIKFLELRKFIENGPGSDGTAFCEYMQRTDKYRKQDFKELYPDMAKAMGYE